MKEQKIQHTMGVTAFLRLLHLWCLLVLILNIPSNVNATASASAGSGIAAGRSSSDSDSATWRFSTPDATDTIEWTSGPNTADRRRFPLQKFGPEQKFNVNPLGGRVFKGFGPLTQTGPLKSKAKTSGKGSSMSVPGLIWGTNWTANWTVTADGQLGGISWFSQVTGGDPYCIFPSQLDEFEIPGDQFDLFFTVALIGGNFSSQGSIGLNSFYEDASGNREIINIIINASGVNVTGDNTAKFYLLSTLDEGPTEIASNQISLAEIQARLEDDVSSDLSVDNPLYLGIVLEDIDVPTLSLDNGALAKIHVNSSAQDQDADDDGNNGGGNLVTLSKFMAISKNNGIHLTWKTATELENAGFHLWRATGEGWKDGDYSTVVRLTNQPIPAQGDSSSYSYIDSNIEPGVTYYYVLEDIDFSGQSIIHWDFIDSATAKRNKIH